MHLSFIHVDSHRPSDGGSVHGPCGREAMKKCLNDSQPKSKGVERFPSKRAQKTLKTVLASSHSQCVHKRNDGSIEEVRLLDHHHVPGLGNEDEARGGDVFMEISGILDRGQLILFATEHKGRKFDLGVGSGYRNDRRL